MMTIACEGGSAFLGGAADGLPLSTEFREVLDLVRTFKTIPLESDLVVGRFG
jgi:hypothetical protein